MYGVAHNSPQSVSGGIVHRWAPVSLCFVHFLGSRRVAGSRGGRFLSAAVAAVLRRSTPAVLALYSFPVPKKAVVCLDSLCADKRGGTTSNVLPKPRSTHTCPARQFSAHPAVRPPVCSQEAFRCWNLCGKIFFSGLRHLTTDLHDACVSDRLSA